MPVRMIGFTGTQVGMTDHQMRSVLQLLLSFKVNVEAGNPGAKIGLVHGGCVGADADAHNLAIACQYHCIEVLPCNIEHKRASLAFHPLVTIKYGKVKPPLDRNQDIVDKSLKLIATPRGYEEVRRSGTWSTVRRARKKGIAVCIVRPSGSIYHE